MDIHLGQILEITFILVLVYLVITNSSGFDSVLSQFGGTYTGAVKTLQGR